jgi:transcriptional regulator with XRE-family HTH domain
MSITFCDFLFANCHVPWYIGIERKGGSTVSDFGKRFKELRISSGLTQDEIAKKLNTSRSRIGMYETGKREPDHETLEMIADFFNVDLDYLLGRSSKTTYIPQNLIVYKENTEEDRKRIIDLFFGNATMDFTELLDGYHNLNKNGKRMLKDYMDYLLSKPEFGNND